MRVINTEQACLCWNRFQQGALELNIVWCRVLVVWRRLRYTSCRLWKRELYFSTGGQNGESVRCIDLLCLFTGKRCCLIMFSTHVCIIVSWWPGFAKRTSLRTISVKLWNWTRFLRVCNEFDENTSLLESTALFPSVTCFRCWKGASKYLFDMTKSLQCLCTILYDITPLLVIPAA